mmetsp:Transcript_17651/g.28992  ORF Transcript_17651/g.28992 Transcript_17651/m.28992 type:complete len:307 (+) Transcript_17651:1141-2061(+)
MSALMSMRSLWNASLRATISFLSCTALRESSLASICLRALSTASVSTATTEARRLRSTSTSFTTSAMRECATFATSLARSSALTDTASTTSDKRLTSADKVFAWVSCTSLRLLCSSATLLDCDALKVTSRVAIFSLALATCASSTALIEETEARLASMDREASVFTALSSAARVETLACVSSKRDLLTFASVPTVVAIESNFVERAWKRSARATLDWSCSRALFSTVLSSCWRALSEITIWSFTAITALLNSALTASTSPVVSSLTDTDFFCASANAAALSAKTLSISARVFFSDRASCSLREARA